MKNFSQFLRRWTWAGLLVFALAMFASPAWAEHVGVVENVGGKVAIAAYSSDGGTVPEWSLWWTPAGGAPVLITSGAAPVGGPGAAVKVEGNLFEFWGMDPSFEQSGANRNNPDFVSPWNIVASGDNYPAFVNIYDLGAAQGEWFCAPEQSWEPWFRGQLDVLGIVRSAEFVLTGDDITFQIKGGRGPNRAPAGENDIAGFMGVVLRDAETGDYLKTTFFDNQSNQWHLLGFYDLQDLVGRKVTLDIIDNHYGDWGWIAVDDFQMNGLRYDANGTYTITFAAVPEPATMTLLAMGGLAMLRRRRA